MQGNLMTTLLALILYLTSGIFGGNGGTQPVTPTTPPDVNQNSIYPYVGTTNTKQATLRSEPANSGSVVVTLNQGANIVILEEKNSWLHVQTEANQTGWIPRWMIAARSQSMISTGKGKIIAGYYVENYFNDPTGYNALAQNLGTINMIIPFTFKVDSYGTISGNHNPKPVTLARSVGADTLAIVNNIQGSNFNSNTVHRMLTSPTARTKAINGIVRVLVEKGFRGVNIDFENVPAKDRIYLTAFFRELAAALRPKNLLVTASVPAKTYDETKSSHSGAYDYKALAPYLDLVMVMTYDEHYSGGEPGPVASYPWVEKVIKYTMQSFSPNKIILGLAGYGYDWSYSSGKARNYTAIQNLIKTHNIAPKWHSVYQVPYFTYKSWGITHQVWYENNHSTAAKMNLVKKYNLRGVALWRLGYEDPLVWRTIQQKLL